MVKLKSNQRESMWARYLQILIPTIIGAISHTVYCLADVFFVSKGVGSLGLAALNVALPVFTLYTTFSLMIGVGAATTISICRGSGQYEQADKIFTLAIGMNLLIGALISIVGSVYLENVARVFGATDELMPYVLNYLRPVNAGAFMYLLSSMMTVIVRADGAPRLVMAASTAGNCCNIVLDYIFVMPLKWGIFGAGLATAIGPFVTVAILSAHFIRRDNGVHFTRRFFTWNGMRRILSNGIGSSILELSSGMVILLFNVVLLNISGASAVAIFSVISNISYVGKGIFSGMAQAAQPIISVSYGAGEFRPLRKANQCAMIVAFLFSGIVTGIAMFFPAEMLHLFLDDAAMLQQGIPAVRLYFISFIFTALNTILMYYYQSLEKPLYTIAISLLRGIVLVIVGLVVLPAFLGEAGVWLTITLAEGLTFLVFFPFLFRFEKNLSVRMNEKS